ncbi:MAG: ABC transporter substrate-binding protein [Myxococcales bacterium]
MRIPALLVLVVAVAACTEKPAPPPPAPEPPKGPAELPEAEPNDTASSAMRLQGEVIVQAALSPEGNKADDDYYRLEAAGEGRTASVSVSAIPGVDLGLQLLDGDGNPLATYNSEPEGKPEKIPAIALARPHVVRVFSPKKGSGGAYTLTVGLGNAKEGAEAEPNDRAVDATPLPLGRAVEGTLGDRADEDWYAFTIEPAQVDAPSPPVEPSPAPTEPAAVADAADAATAEPADAAAAPNAGPAAAPAAPPPPPPAVVRIDLEGVPGVRLQIELANQAQAVFYSARSRNPGDGITVRNVALRPNETQYFAVVKSAWTGTGKEARREYNQDAPYRLTITEEQVQGTAELEPNDDAAHATQLANDGVRQGYFAPKGDVDYFFVRYDQPSIVRVELAGVDRVDPVLSIVKVPAAGATKEETLVRANDGGTREGELLNNVAIGPEGVLVKVEAAARQVDGKWVRDQENANEPYRLTFTSRPDEGADEREPNDAPERATAFELGKPMKGTIHPRKDVDLFKLDLSQSPVKVPLKATVTGILKVDVALALYQVGENGKLSVLQSAEKAKGDQPETLRHTVEPGVYYLEVRDTKNRESNFVDAYQLLVERDE